MMKTNKGKEFNPELTGDEEDDKMDRLEEETEEIETEEELENEEIELDWKAARDKVKELDKKYTDSIDDYDGRLAVNEMKERFNAKERTVSLFDLIMLFE